MSDERWRGSYDVWKTTDPSDRHLGPDPDADEDGDVDAEGCTCPREMGAGGVHKLDKWCPVHGCDPDAECERMRDDREF